MTGSRVWNWMRRIEESSLLWELTFISAGVAAASRWLEWPDTLIRVALAVGAAAFICDTILAVARIKGEMARDKEATEALVDGWYRVAEGYTAVYYREFNRVYIFKEPS